MVNESCTGKNVCSGVLFPFEQCSVKFDEKFVWEINSVKPVEEDLDSESFIEVSDISETGEPIV